MNTSKLKIGIEKANTVSLCCGSLIIAHFEQALVEKHLTETLTV